MAKNRKAESGTVRLGPAVKALFLCAFIAASGVGYVWQKSQLQELGHEITDREGRLTELQRQNKAMRQHLGDLCSIPALDARVHSLNLGLTPPAVTQIVRLYESPAIPPAPDQARLALQTPQ